MRAREVSNPAHTLARVPLSRTPAGPGAIRALQARAGNRAVGRLLQRDLCEAFETAAGSPPKCASEPDCPSGFCVPLPDKKQAMDARNTFKAGFLIAIGMFVDKRVVPLWDDYMGSGNGVGGDPKVRDLSKEFAADFTKANATKGAAKFLTDKAVEELTAHRPPVPPGKTKTFDLQKLVPDAVKALSEHDGPDAMDFMQPKTIPGNIAGGISKDQAGCQVGAHPSSQDDTRTATGTLKVTGHADGSLTVEPDIAFQVRDTIDFCPGGCGGDLERCATVVLSRLEATGISGDIPFTVSFPAPAQPARKIEAPAKPPPATKP